MAAVHIDTFALFRYKANVMRLWHDIDGNFALTTNANNRCVVTCVNVFDAFKERFEKVDVRCKLVNIYDNDIFLYSRYIHLPIDEILPLLIAVETLGFSTLFYWYSDFIGVHTASTTSVMIDIDGYFIMCSIDGDILQLSDMDRCNNIRISLADKKACDSLVTSLNFTRNFLLPHKCV